MGELAEVAIIDPNACPAFDKKKRLNSPTDVLEFLPGLVTASDAMDLDDTDVSDEDSMSNDGSSEEAYQDPEATERSSQFLLSLASSDLGQGSLFNGAQVDDEEDLHQESLHSATEQEDDGSEPPEYQGLQQRVSSSPLYEVSIIKEQLTFNATWKIVLSR